MRILVVLCFLLLLSCAVTEEEAREKLDPILDGNMQTLIGDLADSIVLEDPYFEIIDWEWYENSLYSCNTTYHFYFLADSSYYIRQKFRFNIETRLWELYYNEYKSIIQ